MSDICGVLSLKELCSCWQNTTNLRHRSIKPVT